MSPQFFTTIPFRRILIALVAACVGLSMVWVTLAKSLLLISALLVLLMRWQPLQKVQWWPARHTLCATLLLLSVLAMSLLWSEAPQADALGSWAKYGKLLLPLLLMGLIRTQREALYALAIFSAAQLFLLLSSWLLFFHLPVPWATSNMAKTQYAVFSSYLDQGIMGAVFAGFCWHLRAVLLRPWQRWLAVGVAFLALGNVLFVLVGRSGHVVAVMLISLAMAWELPRRFRLAAFVLPFVLVALLFVSSPKVQQRMTQVYTEVQSYAQQPDTSSGARLGFWRSALQLMAERPLAGAGVGSWSTEYNRIERAKKVNYQDIAGMGNPHQEYLLWGVQLGVPGVLLLLYWLQALWRDSRNMARPYARALQSTVLALAVACLFNATLYDALIGDFFCVLLGLLLCAGRLPATDTAPRVPEQTV